MFEDLIKETVVKKTPKDKTAECNCLNCGWSFKRPNHLECTNPNTMIGQTDKYYFCYEWIKKT